MKDPNQPIARRSNVILWIMIPLLVWGGVLALGALRVGGNHATLRGLIVFACTLAFLGFWLAALVMRRRKQ